MRATGFLSWDCPKIAPPSFRHHEVHSRLRSGRNRLVAFGESVPTLSLVPSSCFCSTSTACSFVMVRACCSSLPTMGFTAFPLDRRCRELSSSPPSPALSRDAFPPSEATPTHSSGSSSRRAAAGTRHRAAQSPARPFTVSLAPSSSPFYRRPPPLGSGRSSARREVSFPAPRGSTLRPCSVRGSVACASLPTRRPRDSHGLGRSSLPRSSSNPPLAKVQG